VVGNKNFSITHRDIEIRPDGIYLLDTVRNRLKDAGLGTGWLAKQLGISRRALDYKLNGTIRWTSDEIRLINKAAGQDVFLPTGPAKLIVSNTGSLLVSAGKIRRANDEK